VKQRSDLDPVRNAVMQFGGERAIEHRVIVSWRLSASSWIARWIDPSAGDAN